MQVRLELKGLFAGQEPNSGLWLGRIELYLGVWIMLFCACADAFLVRKSTSVSYGAMVRSPKGTVNPIDH